MLFEAIPGAAGWAPLVAAVAALAFGGVLKGATGAGFPIIAVPVIALAYDVPTAVVVMLLPSLLANAWQAWRYRAHLPQTGFAWPFAAAGLVGAVLGTALLARVPGPMLMLAVAGLVTLYIAFRLLRPGWALSGPLARRLAIPAGLTAGTLQGATGISAPISLTFLNACQLPRPVFVATVSLFFVASTTSQAVALAAHGMLTLQGLALSAGALAVIFATMPLGEVLARRIPPRLFDRVILLLLAALALRLFLAA